MSSVEPIKFSHWCILEILGHNKFAGRVSEETIAGAAFLRIDIPATKKQPEFTKFFGPSSVYSISPVTEEIAKGMAESLNVAPVSVFELPEWMRDRLKVHQPPIGLTFHERDDGDWDDDDDDRPDAA